MSEQQLIAEIARRVVARLAEADPRYVVVGISNRHVHLSDADFGTLFGRPAPEVKKYVRQRGEFAAEETVTLHGPKGSLSRVRVMGPNRPATQVELSRTDCYALGVEAPLAQSGQLDQAAPIEIEGPAGRVRCERAVIVAGRHIHMSPADAQAVGVADQDRVSVVFGGERGGRMDNFLIRVKDSYLAELHLDTDEGNAIGAVTGDFVRIVTD